MKHAVGALAILAAWAASPALADGPDPAYRPQAPAYGPGYAPRPSGWQRHRGYRGQGYAGRGYGRPAYRGTGETVASYGPAPAYGILTGPSEYTEEYIARGLIYNTPPEPAWPSYSVISSRY